MSEKNEMKFGSLTYDQLLRKYPEVSTFEQSRVVLRNFITKELYAGPIGPFVVKVDPLTTKERAIEIESWFKTELNAFGLKTDVVVVEMESRSGK